MDPLFVIVLMVLIAFIAAWYWSKPNSGLARRWRLRGNEVQLVALKKPPENPNHMIADLDGKLSKQIDALNARLTQLGTDLSEIRRTTVGIDKHVDALESKSETVITKVDAVGHQVDMDVGELKRIDEHVKDSIGRAKGHALQIQNLEDEVRALERELSIPPPRMRRDHHT